MINEEGEQCVLAYHGLDENVNSLEDLEQINVTYQKRVLSFNAYRLLLKFKQSKLNKNFFLDDVIVKLQVDENVSDYIESFDSMEAFEASNPSHGTFGRVDSCIYFSYVKLFPDVKLLDELLKNRCPLNSRARKLE